VIDLPNGNRKYPGKPSLARQLGLFGAAMLVMDGILREAYHPAVIRKGPTSRQSDWRHGCRSITFARYFLGLTAGVAS
jgi:hypothetical protein